MAREKLGEILIRAGVLTNIGLQQALNEQQRWGGQLGRYLVELGLISEETLVRALSTQYKLPAVAIEPSQVNIAVGRLVPRKICEKYNLICFRADSKNKFLDIAMSDPSKIDAIDEVRVATKCNVRPHIASPTVIDRSINFIFYGDPALGAFGEINLNAEQDLSPDSKMRMDHQTRARSPIGVEPEPVSKEKAGQSWSPGVIPREPEKPLLEVKVTTSNTANAPDDQPQTVKLPPPVMEDNFHITMDVPVVDKSSLASPLMEDRLKLLEAIMARNSAIIQATLEVLLKKKLLTQEEILHILSMSPR